ncbi:hypothetical protein [Nocardiopsis tropica]|uniref:Uncharacterized protein n=1 Tax=Nocardiopsis tropica TaxID=109330 RepID=A0ABU7KR62_9ACTN|nr:hypothetical protein [Nocardiopsis umidischolae]MEE2051789.1 hypothetical protein [Nocardiopsis umidischolae]
MSTAIRAHQIDATEARLIEAHDAQCTDRLCGRTERSGRQRHTFQCAQSADIGRQVNRMRQQYRAQAPAVGDTVEYHGSLTEAHGPYAVLSRSEDTSQDHRERPEYTISDGQRRIHVRRASISRVMRPQPQAPEPPAGQLNLF